MMVDVFLLAVQQEDQHFPRWLSENFQPGRHVIEILGIIIEKRMFFVQ